MKKGKFKAIIYLIAITALVTVVIQVYRNVQNYKANQQWLVGEVQQSLDNAVEAYYANLVEDDVVAYVFSDSNWVSTDSTFREYRAGWTSNADSAIPNDLLGHIQRIDISDSLNHTNLKLTLGGSFDTISLSGSSTTATVVAPYQVGGSRINFFSDSTKFINRKDFANLTKKVLFSLTRDNLNGTRLNKLVREELDRKNINIDFELDHKTPSSFNLVKAEVNPDYELSAFSNSNYLRRGHSLEIRFSNDSLVILKRGLADLLISLLISVLVIGSLLYLYRIINQQKQLAEIKNDLISNITHEFKTPIATVTTALEGIANFNQANDPEKTKKYLDISGQQLQKLNLMVEKLLETATLETDALELSKTPINLNQLLHTLIEKYKMVTSKSLHLHMNAQDAVIQADGFHLENALSNLIDNAIKYGGHQIEVSIIESKGFYQVTVQDDGGFIEKSQKEKVFDKFYRIPQGNQHDVKGFGIGLYYTKKIIEKHGGTINLVLAPNRTAFEVALS